MTELEALRAAFKAFLTDVVVLSPMDSTVAKVRNRIDDAAAKALATLNTIPAPTPAPTPTPTPTGVFKVQGSDILGLDGKVFVGVGPNLGTPNCFDQSWGNAKGHAADAKAAGHTIVRLGFIGYGRINWSRMAPVSGGGGGLSLSAAIAEAVDIIREYRALGIVVQVALFYAGGDQATESAYIKGIAAAFKDDSGVWYNLNEHSWTDYVLWVSQFRQLHTDVRSVGNRHIVVCDVMNAGSDAGWEGATRRLFDPTVGPALLASLPDRNVAFSMHQYGGIDTNMGFAAYVDAVDNAGLALMIGEFGFTLEPWQTTAGPNNVEGWTMNRNGTLSVLANFKAKRLIILVWHGNHNDGYSLKAPIAPFWSTGPDSELGQRFKTAISTP